MARLWRTLYQWDVVDAQPVRGGCQEVAQQQNDKKPLVLAGAQGEGIFCFGKLGDLDRGTDHLDCILPVSAFGQVVCLDHDAVGVTLRQAVWNKEVQLSR